MTKKDISGNLFFCAAKPHRRRKSSKDLSYSIFFLEKFKRTEQKAHGSRFSFLFVGSLQAAIGTPKASRL
jgi:hypothetical protein